MNFMIWILIIELIGYHWRINERFPQELIYLMGYIPGIISYI